MTNIKQTFEELKEKITSQSILTLLKRNSKFWVKIDALEYAVERVLSQEQWISIVFLSRTMQLAERNYEINNKELLTIIEARTKWRQYVTNLGP